MTHVYIAALFASSIAISALAEPPNNEIVDLRSMVETLRTEVDELRAETADDWLTEQRSEQIRGLVQDVLADADTRSSLQGDGATSGYDKGFFIRSGDGKWSMKINGQIQTRFMYNDAAGQTADYGFEIRRFKLGFKGHIMDPSWTYKLTVINQRDSQGTSSAGFYAEDAWLRKTTESGFYVQVGQFKAPLLREELTSSSAQLPVERSMLNNQFTYGWTQGAQIGRKGTSFWWRAMMSDGPNAANQQSQGFSDTVSLAARADIRLAGDWANWKSFTGRGVPDDFYAFIGAAFQWFNNSNRGYVGVPGVALNHTEYGGYDGLRSYGFTADGSIGGEGWTAYGAFMWANNGATVNNAGVSVEGNTSWGVLAQAGFFVSKDVQLFGRYEYGHIGDYAVIAPAAQGGNGRLSVLTVGANVWLATGRTLKWTSDFGYAFDTINNGGAMPGPSADFTSSGNGWRSDTDDNTGQWLVRTQLQVMF
jgi:hypothetical protein